MEVMIEVSERGLSYTHTRAGRSEILVHVEIERNCEWSGWCEFKTAGIFKGGTTKVRV
jgi:hypothetical protein